MRIYLDHNATTPLRPEVVEAMLAVLSGVHGNPSSTHGEGARASALLEAARDQVASCLGAASEWIHFTAGASEANNALLATLREGDAGRKELITSTTEHPSILEPARQLEAAGIPVTWLPVDSGGLIDPEVVFEAVSRDTALVSLVWANNETGVIQRLEEISKGLRERGVLLHVDATQAVGKARVDVREIEVDYLSCSAHKLNGPKGTGCLMARPGVPLQPLIRGGGQERGLRGGTENVAGIVGFGKACELAEAELGERVEAYGSLRDRLWQGLYARVPGLRRNGSAERVLSNTLNLEFEGAAGEVLLQALDLEGVAVSAGAACHSGSISPSHVLTEMGRTPEEARSSLRLSVGWGVDEEQIDSAIFWIAKLVERARDVGRAG
jgi:cysteine desulfurase